MGKTIKVPSFELPVLTLRDIVLLPDTSANPTFGRDSSHEAIQYYLSIQSKTNYILVVTQKDEQKDDPEKEDLYTIGTLAEVIKLERDPTTPKTYKLHLRGVARVKLNFVQETPFFTATPELLENTNIDGEGIQEAADTLRNKMMSLFDVASRINSDPALLIPLRAQMSSISNPSQLADLAASKLTVKIELKQSVLEELDVLSRLSKVISFTTREIAVQEMRTEVERRFRSEAEEAHRRAILMEQRRLIDKELGNLEEGSDLDEIEEKIEAAGMPERVLKVAKKEVVRLKRTPSISSEYSVILNYIEWLLDLPWSKSTEDILDLKVVRKTLDKGHYGLEEPKKRILEFLAVRKLKNNNKGPILCFVGPPGVGKTTLAKDIAEALNRKNVRISLGGIHDEAEIRGHRRTYVGALPGKILSQIRSAEVNNPVFILDEIDKVGHDLMRGDPSSALLEVLDPEQNTEFTDNYLEVPFDLSKVLFICTANQTNTIQPALKDRMEIIRINGYTEEEKFEIAKRHLISREREENGLKKADMSIAEDAIPKFISGYTREAGVRKLQQVIGKAARHIAVKIATERRVAKRITVNNMEDYLGKAKFHRELAEKGNPPGVVTGLAWTPVGGVILFAESVLHPGKGEVKISGLLGKSMKESAQAAMSYVKSRARLLHLEKVDFDKIDVHLHFPDGVEKDGPSAGITQVVSLVSLLSGIPVPGYIAMTGEISFRGRLLKIGGLKDKLLAAIRAGAKEVYIPKDNEYELEEMSKDILNKLEIHAVDTIDEVVAGVFPTLFDSDLPLPPSNGYAPDKAKSISTS